MLTILVVAAVLGCIPAAIAAGKGHSFASWWVYGFLLFIVALIHAIFVGARTEASLARERGDRKCPACAEYIKGDAKICRYCKTEQTPRASLVSDPTAPKPRPPKAQPLSF